MIIPALPEDAVALHELVNSAYRGESSRKGWTTEADLFDGPRVDLPIIEELLASPGHLILKYVEGGIIRGCVQLHREGDKLYLGMLTVTPTGQGSGIGKQLLHAAEQEARKQKCVAVFMTVIPIRHELMAWYNRHGYDDTGERKSFESVDKHGRAPKIYLELAVLEKML